MYLPAVPNHRCIFSIGKEWSVFNKLLKITQQSSQLYNPRNGGQPEPWCRKAARLALYSRAISRVLYLPLLCGSTRFLLVK